MASDPSIAPRERVNIVYKPATGGQAAEIELPLKLMVVGDFTMRADSTPLEERKVISVDKDNFNDVLRNQNLSLSFTVANRLSDQPDDEMAVNLKFDKLDDFKPESIARQVPELNKLLELRKALLALKGPLANLPDFRNKLKSLMESEADLERLLKELGAQEKSGE